MAKQIEVSDEMYEKLMELGKEMTEQDPRGTRMPHLFQVRDYKKVYDHGMNGDTKMWYSEGEEYESLDDLKSYFENMEKEIPKNLEELYEDPFSQLELDELLEENGLNPCSYTREPVYTNAFFTAKACKEHIEGNRHHYCHDADDYLNHSWRNPEMELVSEFLCNLVGKTNHT